MSMSAVDLIRAELYRQRQVENSADSTGVNDDDWATQAQNASINLRQAMDVAMTTDEAVRYLVRAGARIAQAIDILTQ